MDKQRLFKWFERVNAKLNYLFFFFLFLFSGCEVDENEESGSLFLNLSSDFSITAVTKAETKAITDGPSVNDFKVAVYQGESGTSLYKTWNSFADMGSEVNLPQNTYVLKASYGEQHKGAFETPYYEGSAPFSIIKKKSTSVSVVCKIANTKVTLEYSDGFKQYFKDWTAKVASTGDSLTITKDETRATYFEPGQVGMNLMMTRQDGKTLQYAPPVIATEGGKHYRVRLDVTTGGAGGVNLVIKFDKTTEEKPIYVDISGDNPVIVSAPYISSTGFSSGMPITVTEGTSVGKVYTLVNARAKIKSCVLRTDSRSLFDNGWPASVDLADPTANVSGLKGITSTQGMKGAQMAEIDVTELIPLLPASSQTSLLHTFFLEVTDETGKKNDEFVLMAQMSVPGFRLLNLEGIDTSNGSALIRFEMTSGDVEKIMVEAKNDYGIWSKLDWKEKPKLTNVANIYSGVITIKVDDKKDVRLNYNNGARISNSSTLYGGNYSFELEMADGQTADPTVNSYIWATKAYVKVKNAYISPYKLSFRKDSKDGDELETEILMDNTILIKGLDEGTSNTIVAVVKDAVAQSKPFTIKTEDEVQLPNSDFESWNNDARTIQQGGKTVYKSLGKEKEGNPLSKEVIKYDPIEWSTLNDKTCSWDAKNLNTWYVIPSTTRSINHSKGYYSACVRSVSWDDDGEPIQKNYDAKSQLVDKYGRPIPPEIRYTSAGKLFLGGSIDDNSKIGYKLVSRPLFLNFQYLYQPVGNMSDIGVVRVVIENRNGGVITPLTDICQEDLENTNSKFISGELKFNYLNTRLKATHIKIEFSSSKKEETIITVKHVNETTILGVTTANYSKENTCTATGSELYIDDLKLIYE